MTTPIDPHAWFREHIDAFIAGGLSPEERASLKSHAAECAACEAALLEAAQADEAIRKLFNPVTPSAHFEENLIMNLRTLTAPRPLLHPSVIRAATGVAAIIVLGGFGLIGHRAMKDGKFPELSIPNISIPRFAWFNGVDSQRVKTGSNLRHLGQEARTYDVRDLLTDVPNFNNGTPDLSDFEAKAHGRSSNASNHFGEKTLGEIPIEIKMAVINGRGGELKGGSVESFALRLPEQLATNVKARLLASVDGREKKAEAQNQWSVDAGKQVFSKDRVESAGLDRLAVRQHGLGDTDQNSAPKHRDNTVLYAAIATDKPALATSDFGTIPPAQKIPPAVITDFNLATSDFATIPSAGNGIVRYKGMDEISKSQADGETSTPLGRVNRGEATGTPPSPQSSVPSSAAGRIKSESVTATGMGYAYDSESKVANAPIALYFKPNDTQGGDVVVKKLSITDPGLVVLSDVDSKVPGSLGALGIETPLKETELALQQVKSNPLERQLPLISTDAIQPSKPQTAGEAATPPPALPPSKVPENILAQQAQQSQRKIIRNGQVEFEVDSFDSSFMQIGKIVVEEGGYVSSTDSEKLSNGKVKGTVTVRVPPDRLDVLVLKLRGLGDLKSQKIAAQDITKQYTDLESGLRAARTMEERLLEIIKSGKGEVKDLVAAETQLGVYRERIEQIEGELRYYGNLVSLSTLNITLLERDLKTPTAAFETEEVQAGIEVEDVEKARNDALKAIDDAKGRVIESNLKKLDAGQLTATIVAELTPESAGALTDRLKQLGRVARLEADRKQTTQGGTGAPTGVKMVRKATRFNISLYNLANIAPRETVNLTLAAEDVEVAYKAILAVMNADDAGSVGRIVSSTLNSQKKDQTSGAITLEVKSDKANAVETAVRATGEVLHIAVSENPDANNVTRAKRGYSISLISVAQVAPRETQTLQVAAKNVPAAYAKLLTALQDPKQPSRILSSQLNEQDRQNVTGQIDVEVPRTAVGAVEAVLAGVESDVYSRNISRANEAQNTLDSKVRLSVSLIAADRLQPRETTTIALEVNDVEATLANVANTPGARVVERQLSKQQSGRIVARAMIDVPLTSAPATLDTLRNLGTVRVVESAKNQQVPEGPLARARFDVTLGNAAPIISPEDGVGARLHQGLQTSLNGLTFSLMLIVIGVCLIGPFALVIWGGWKFLRRGKAKSAIV